MRRNPGSRVDITLEPDNAFQRMFVFFKASIDGLKLGWRPFMRLDGCHLRSKYHGCLLSAIALDGNNGLFPIVFDVVEGESSDTWYEFL